MFDNVCVSALRDFDKLRSLPGVRTAGDLAASRPVFPVSGALPSVLSRGGLRRGDITQIVGTHGFSVALAVVSKATQERHWCASLGVGVPAVAALGDFDVALDHFVNVAVEPGDRVQALSILIDTFAIVITQPVPMSPGQRSRLHSKVREKNMSLIVLRDFPHAGEKLTVSEPRWEGLDYGSGHLSGYSVRVTNPAMGSTRIELPGAEQVSSQVIRLV